MTSSAQVGVVGRALSSVDFSSSFSHRSFAGYALGGTTFISVDGGTYELIPTPEPGTVLAVGAWVLYAGSVGG